MTGWKKMGSAAPSERSLTETESPLTVAAKPVPDHANFCAEPSETSTRPNQRTPPEITGATPLVMPLAPPLAVLPPVPAVPLVPPLPTLPAVAAPPPLELPPLPLVTPPAPIGAPPVEPPVPFGAPAPPLESGRPAAPPVASVAPLPPLAV